MKTPSRLLRDIVAPSPDALYERAMKDEKTYPELSDGTEIVPIFNPSVSLEALGDEQPLIDKSGNCYGTKQLYSTETDFGIDYAAAVYQPNEPRYGFYVDIDTPLCTGINGLNDEVAARLTEEVGVPVILKGPEFSGNRKKRPQQLASVALAATNISQSFSAENSMAISDELLLRNPNIPRTAVAYGKSRGAMVGGKKHPYAVDRDINILHYRLIDPCIGRRALGNPGDLLRIGVWPATDMMKSVPAFAKFALEGKLGQRAKTIETNLGYVAGMLVGTIPSLLSGEEIGRRIPLHKGISLMHMANNPIADTDFYLQQFAWHKNFDNHPVPDTHIGGIILPRNIRRTVRHFREFGAEFERVGENEQLINWDTVHNNPKKATVTRIHAA